MAVIGSPEQVTRELPQKLGMLERQKIDPFIVYENPGRDYTPEQSRVGEGGNFYNVDIRKQRIGPAGTNNGKSISGYERECELAWGLTKVAGKEQRRLWVVGTGRGQGLKNVRLFQDGKLSDLDSLTLPKAERIVIFPRPRIGTIVSTDKDILEGGEAWRQIVSDNEIAIHSLPYEEKVVVHP